MTPQPYRASSWLALAMLACVAIMPMRACGHATAAQPGHDCIGLVLGGGGARGAAHIGVLEVLEREHIPICVISGTSMGAIVGSMYAVGYTPEEMRKVLGGLDWKALFDDNPPRPDLPMRRKNDDFRYLLNFEIGFHDGQVVMPTGLIQGQKLQLLLRRLLLPAWNIDDFDHLQIPFNAVAANLGNGQPVVLDHGNLALAVRASMSVPGAFAPVHYDGQLLVDGGILDNVPVDVARHMGATRLIVVNVGTPLAAADTMTNPFAVMNQMLGVATLESTQRQLRSLGPNDLLITPKLGNISAASFGDAAQAIRIGKQAAEAMLPELQRFSEPPAQWAAWRAAHRRQAFDPGLVAFVRVVDASPRDTRVIAKHMAADVGKPLDIPGLEKQISDLYGNGDYATIGWQPVARNGQHGIEITPEDKAWGPLFGKFGFQLGDDFAGRANYALSLETTATNLNDSGARWTNGIWLGQVNGVYSRWFQPVGDFDRGYLMPDLGIRSETVPLFDGTKQIADYRFHYSHVGVEAGWTPTPAWNVALRMARGHDRANVMIGPRFIFPNLSTDWSSLRLGATWDTLDNADFPTHGGRVHVEYEAYRRFLGGAVNGNVARLTADWAVNWGYGPFKRYTVLLGARASTSTGSEAFMGSLEPLDFLGGFLDLSGHAERSVIGDQSALGRAVMYRRMGGSLRDIFGVPLYLGTSLEAGNVWNDRKDVDFGNLIYSGSVFGGIDTALGPLFLGFGHASDGANSWYLTFGSLLRPRQ